MKMKLLKESSDRDMIKARVKYTGQSEYAKGDRFAEIVAPVEYEEKITNILAESGWDYEIYGDSIESFFAVMVDDKDDYRSFMSYWKQAKREIK